MEEIKITLSHSELIIILNSLDSDLVDEKRRLKVNKKSWDKYEFDTVAELRTKYLQMIKKIKKKIANIQVY